MEEGRVTSASSYRYLSYKSMGASAISKKSSIKPVHITVIRSPPLQLPQPPKPAVLPLALPAPLAITEEEKGETDPNPPLTETLRTNARRRKIVWQASTPESCAKVHYVNIAYASSISPSSQCSVKSVGLSPSTTPSPEGPAIGSFSEATKLTTAKSMYDLSHLLDSGSLTPINKGSAQHGPLQIRYKLNVPKQALLSTPEPASEEKSSQLVVTERARSKGPEKERTVLRSSEALYRKSRPL